MVLNQEDSKDGKKLKSDPSLRLRSNLAGNSPKTVIGKGTGSHTHKGDKSTKKGIGKPPALNIANQLHDKLVSPQKPLDTINITSVDEKDMDDANISNLLEFCPCQQSDESAIYIVCQGCREKWHTKCVNLVGLKNNGVNQIKQHWKCPWCHTSPFTPTAGKGPNIEPDPDAVVKEFFSRIDDIKKYNEDLRDSATSIDFFNTHVKHLLLKEDEFTAHTRNTSEINSKLDIIVENFKGSSGNVNEQLSELIENLQNQLNGLSSCQAIAHDSTASQDLNKKLMLSISSKLETLQTIEPSVLSDIASIKASVENMGSPLVCAESDKGTCHNTSSVPSIQQPNTVSPHLKQKTPLSNMLTMLFHLS